MQHEGVSLHELKKYSDKRNANFNCMATETFSMTRIKNLGFSKSYIYIGEAKIIIELDWRGQTWLSINELYHVLYSILQFIEHECSVNYHRYCEVSINKIWINDELLDLKSYKFLNNTSVDIVIEYSNHNENKLLDELILVDINIDTNS